MNKLREFIEANRKNPCGATWRDLQDYLCDNRDAIADLIDAAQECGITLRADHPLSIALSKLEK